MPSGCRTNRIGTLDYNGQNYKDWTVPTANSVPWGIAAGPDGAVWFTELAGNNVGRLDDSGNITEVDADAPVVVDMTRPSARIVDVESNDAR